MRPLQEIHHDDLVDLLKLSAVALVALAINGVMLYQFLKIVWTYRAAQGWALAHGRIVESAIYVPEGKTAEHFKILYEFTVGETFLGDTPRASGDFFYTDEIQREYVKRYREGQSVTVFYDPRNPRRNCIDRSDWSGLVARAGVFGITLIVSAVVGLGVWKALGFLGVGEA